MLRIQIRQDLWTAIEIQIERLVVECSDLSSLIFVFIVRVMI